MKLYFFPLLILCTLPLAISAQEGKSKIIFSGYLQNQFQVAQNQGVSTWAGGDFEKNSDNRFLIRRGRLKASLQQGIAQMTVQLDATPDAVRFVDAFIKVKRRDDDAFSLTAGLFDRPFGYAVSYSSVNRDFPERPIAFQNLFPKEKDLGVQLAWNPSKDLSFLSINLAAMNGSGVTAKDYDGKKDFIGNLHFHFKELAPTISLGFGTSFYRGFVKSGTNQYYSPTSSGFQAISNPSVADEYFARNYWGADIQLELAHPFGKTALKSEYLQGKQPGLAESASVSITSTNRSFAALPKSAIYQRNFASFYIWLTQQLGTSKFNALLNYDYYDPNTNVSGTQIGLANSQTTAGDLKFNSWGFGLAYHLNEQVKLTAFYDHLINENSSLSNYLTDKKDDVFTLRLQYKW